MLNLLKAAFAVPAGDATAKAVLTYLILNSKNVDGKVYHASSIGKIAAGCETTRNSVSSKTMQLEARGIITIENHLNGNGVIISKTYVINKEFLLSLAK